MCMPAKSEKKKNTNCCVPAKKKKKKAVTLKLMIKGGKKILEGLPCQWLRIHLPMQGLQVSSLVGELRSHMPQGH